MPLRYSKVLRGIFKEILHMQHIGLLDAATDDKLREYLHTHRKAIRELQRADKRQQCPVPAAPDAWDDFFTAGTTVSDDFGDGIK